MNTTINLKSAKMVKSCIGISGRAMTGRRLPGFTKMNARRFIDGKEEMNLFLFSVMKEKLKKLSNIYF